MRIKVEKGLLYVTASLTCRGQRLTLSRVILDTGSAGTMFSVERVSTIGFQPEPEDAIQRIRGVGGEEFVFTKRVDTLALGDLQLSDFEIGAMDYGLEIEGIIGSDYLLQAGAIIDLNSLEIYAATKPT